MTTATDEERPATLAGGLVALLRAPFAAEAWVDTSQVVMSFLVAMVAWTVVVTLGTAVLSLAITAVLAVPFLAAMYGASRMFSSWQRSRVEGLLGPAIPSTQRPGGATWLRRLLADTRDPNTWRQLSYHLLSGFTSTVFFVLVIGCWVLGILLSTIAAYRWALREESILAPMLNPGGIAVLTAAGLVLFFAAPWVARVVATLDIALAEALLAPSRGAELARRVTSLAESRAGVIDAADSERRRIERDLHDGTQQRLVSLALSLGIARTTLVDVPEPARDAIVEAHEQAKLALADLRGVVRGMHPAILDDLGLDAALSGIAARSTVPVRLLVELPRRAPRAVEAVAYFVVSEALTNVAKHARATQVDIVVEQTPDGLLRIIVSDNGVGGAQPERGTGLSGLRQRISSVDGTMTISSPPGGPTLIVVELPCAS